MKDTTGFMTLVTGLSALILWADHYVTGGSALPALGVTIATVALVIGLIAHSARTNVKSETAKPLYMKINVYTFPRYNRHGYGSDMEAFTVRATDVNAAFDALVRDGYRPTDFGPPVVDRTLTNGVNR